MAQVKTPQVFAESHFKNESDEPVRFIIPVGVRVRVCYDSFSYELRSTPWSQQSVALRKGDSMERL